MPSPFPGMDPYLEAPALWEGFHNNLITYVRNELVAVLPNQYTVVTEMRVYLDLLDMGSERISDVEVIRAPGRRRVPCGNGSALSGSPRGVD